MMYGANRVSCFITGIYRYSFPILREEMELPHPFHHHLAEMARVGLRYCWTLIRPALFFHPTPSCRDGTELYPIYFRRAGGT